MIENLQGIQETVNFKTDTNIRLYVNDNVECYPKHWHAPLEVIMPLHNSYNVNCCNTEYHLREGDVLIISPGSVHSMEDIEGKRIIFQADITSLYSIKELGATLSILSPALLITAESAPEIHETIERLILEILNEYLADAPLSEAAIYSKLIHIFVLIGRSYSFNNQPFPNNSTKQHAYTEHFLFICDYINEHFNEGLTLDFIANLSGFSKFHFSRLFKQFTNVSFYKYLNRKRIENAEKLLVNQNISITDVALQCGFSNLSTFIRMFKIIKNCTPTEFKSMFTS